MVRGSFTPQQMDITCTKTNLAIEQATGMSDNHKKQIKICTAQTYIMRAETTKPQNTITGQVMRI